MINHARTLLLNRNGDNRPNPTYYLEEYVDPAYRALTLPGYLATVRNILIGANSDNAYANFRLREIMRTVDSTNYGNYITDLDPRVTYRRDRSVVQRGNSLTYTPITPGTTLALVFVGELSVSQSVQRLQYDWTVEQITPTVVRVTSVQSGQSQDITFSYDSGISSLIPLIGQSNLFFRFIEGGSSTNGSVWLLEGFAQPDEELPDLLVPLSQLGDAALYLLFPNRDPYTVFKNLWQQGIFWQDRLTGMALAYAYGANEVLMHG